MLGFRLEYFYWFPSNSNSIDIEFSGNRALSTLDFVRSRLDAMIDMRHPRVVLAGRLPWSRMEAELGTKFAQQDHAPQQVVANPPNLTIHPF